MPGNRTRRRRAISGKGRWKSGADTCVFKPVVACTDGRTPSGKKEDYVSRIVERNSSDAAFEEILRTNFPLLTKHRLISVSELACTPSYVQSDKDIILNSFRQPYIDDNIQQGCSSKGIKGPYLGNPQRQLNLVTPLFGPSLTSNGFYGWTFDKRVKSLKSALFASVCLVPDKGPWVVHLDLHMGNVLTTLEPHKLENVDFGMATFTFDGVTSNSAISDWGRVLVFKSLDDATVIQNLKELSNFFMYPYARYANMIQHPLEAMTLLDRAISEASARSRVSPSGKNGIRGLVPYTLFYQSVYDTGKRYIGPRDEEIKALLSALLTTENQKDLMTAVSKLYNKLMSGKEVFPVKQEKTCEPPVKEVTSPEARNVIIYRGGPEKSMMASKEELSCSVQTTVGGTSRYIRLWLPPGGTKRERIAKTLLTDNIMTPETLKFKPGDVYMWVEGIKPGSNERELILVRSYSAFEVATLHVTISNFYGFSHVTASGEARIVDANTIEFNFLSGTYMDPILKTMDPDCKKAYLPFVANNIKEKFKGKTVKFPEPQVPFVTQALEPSLKTLAFYIALGIHVEVFDNEKTCREAKAPPPGGEATIDDAEADYEARRKSYKYTTIIHIESKLEAQGRSRTIIKDFLYKLKFIDKKDDTFVIAYFDKEGDFKLQKQGPEGPEIGPVDIIIQGGNTKENKEKLKEIEKLFKPRARAAVAPVEAAQVPAGPAPVGPAMDVSDEADAEPLVPVPVAPATVPNATITIVATNAKYPVTVEFPNYFVINKPGTIYPFTDDRSVKGTFYQVPEGQPHQAVLSAPSRNILAAPGYIEKKRGGGGHRRAKKGSKTKKQRSFRRRRTYRN